MKTADLIPGTLYAKRYTKYDAPRPLLLIDKRLFSKSYRSNYRLVPDYLKKLASATHGMLAIEFSEHDLWSIDNIVEYLFEQGTALVEEHLRSESEQATYIERQEGEDKIIYALRTYPPQAFVGPWDTIKTLYDEEEQRKKVIQFTEDQRRQENADEFDALSRRWLALPVETHRLTWTSYSDSPTVVRVDRADLVRVMELIEQLGGGGELQ